MVKAEVCKTSIPRFDSGRRLQLLDNWLAPAPPRLLLRFGIRRGLFDGEGTEAEKGTALFAALAGISGAIATNPWLPRIERGGCDGVGIGSSSHFVWSRLLLTGRAPLL